MKFLLSILFIAALHMSWAQAPNQFRYQAVARDATGEVLPSTNVGIEISIRDLAATGTIIFRENHNVTTNEFGLFNLSIGAGTATLGSISAINWSSGAKFIEVGIDLTGGVTYESLGSTQLLSVPYALYANTAQIPLLPNGTAFGNTSYWNGTNWVINSNNLYNDGFRIGIGNTTPSMKLDVNGNINLMEDSAYMINQRKVLWNTGDRNLFVGDSAGYNNSLGYTNSFLGFNAGKLNEVGSQNTFVGAETGLNNFDGHMNTFVGRRAGYSNTMAVENTFIGAYAGQSTTEGNHNSFMGVTTGASNTTGEENTFLGAHAGYYNVDGSMNTFVGNFAGVDNGSGNFNTIVGFEANVATPALTNVNLFGYGAIGTSDNSVVIGNTAITSIGGQVGWSTLSDGRFKSNVQANDLGLAFIKSLQTVSYNYTFKEQQGNRYYGLIAQDVERTLNELGADFSGLVRPKNEQDHYAIRYAEFVVPLIKAVQEQDETIESLKAENEELRKRIEAIEYLLSKSEK